MTIRSITTITLALSSCVIALSTKPAQAESVISTWSKASDTLYSNPSQPAQTQQAQQNSKLPMYDAGDFPDGKLYSFPDLENLVGKSLSNSWLYGALKLKYKSDGAWTFNTYGTTTGPILSFNGGTGSTTVIVEFPNGRYPKMDVGQIATFGKDIPLELLSVKKSAQGNLVVRTRNRLRNP